MAEFTNVAAQTVAANGKFENDVNMYGTQATG